MNMNDILRNGLLTRLIAGEADGISLWIVVALCAIGAVIAYLLGGSISRS